MLRNRTNLSDADFISEFLLLGGTGLAKKYHVTERSVYARRAALSSRFDKHIPAPSDFGNVDDHPEHVDLTIKNGYVIVGSDFHIWPGVNGPALRAFKKLVDDIRPSAVILNGDVLDFPRISRHPPIGWENTPSPQQEIEAAQDHLSDIEKASRRARKIWTLGNHDSRFETKLATVAPEFAKVAGIHLKDHFALWEPGWLARINGNTVVKHRWKGGVHATHNNTVNSGVTMVTGHLHSQKVTPFTDYNGTRYGVDTGCVADPAHRAFTGYTEGNPLNWRSGFCLLHYIEGRLLEPQLVSVWDEKHVQYRGELIKV